MSDSNYEKIDLKRAFVSSDPSVTTITPQSGKHAGKETAVAEFNVGKPQWERDDKGNFHQKDTEYHTVRMYGDEAKQVGNLLKKGMAVNVEGSKTTETWQGKDGSEKSKSVINATDVSLNLSQKRIKSVEFDQTPTKDAAKDGDKGNGGKAAEAQAAQAPKPQKIAKKAADKVQSPDR